MLQYDAPRAIQYVVLVSPMYEYKQVWLLKVHAGSN